MGRFSTRKKLITFSLIIVTLILAFSALFLGSQMGEAQKKMRDLQNQVAYYENMTDTLQTQTSSLETQINDLQNPIDNVTFTAISVGPWYVGEYAPPPYSKDINITLQNLGTRSIGGATLDFKVEGNTTVIDQFSIHVISGQLGILHVQESKNMTVRLIASTNDRTQVLSDCSLIITLMLDKPVLDGQTVTIGT
jgi:type II secretory pathway pseudopilin PulG